MKKCSVTDITKGIQILESAEMADSFTTRLKGLTGRMQLEESCGMIIKPCRSIHMIGMRFDIDVLFVNKNEEICHIIAPLKRMKISPYIAKAKYVIECPAGTVHDKNIEVGDKVGISS